jgi:hypothetical protein
MGGRLRGSNTYGWPTTRSPWARHVGGKGVISSHSAVSNERKVIFAMSFALQDHPGVNKAIMSRRTAKSPAASERGRADRSVNDGESYGKVTFATERLTWPIFR